MLQANGSSDVGNVMVYTSNNSGHSPEQLADMALNKRSTCHTGSSYSAQR